MTAEHDLSNVSPALLGHYDYLQVADKSHFALGQPDGRYLRIRRPYTSLVREHLLDGRLSLSFYMLSGEGRAIQGVVDSDKETGLRDLQRVGLELRRLGLKPVLVPSRRGGHLHIFHQPLDPDVPVTLLTQVMKRTNVEAEVFPKGRGLSCIRAIFARHPTTGLQYPLLDLDTLEPVARGIPAQLSYLSRVGRATPRIMAEALAKATAEKRLEKPPILPVSGDATELKQGLDILRVVGDDLQLNKSGRRWVGLCPFHEDLNPSLVVYPETQSFFCFGCRKSGDVIRYLALRRGVRDGEVLRELRQQSR